MSRKEIKTESSPKIEWIKVKDAVGLLWKQNPKLHDIGSICESIARYGFQELPKFDINLENTQGERGAFVAGNGRIEALWRMEKDGGYDLPRGIGMDKDGDWCMPFVAGVDVESEAIAQAYALDSNNLVMLGGDVTGFDLAKIWGKGMAEVVERLAESGVYSVGVNEENIEAVLKALGREEVSPKRNCNEIICPQCGYRIK